MAKKYELTTKPISSEYPKTEEGQKEYQRDLRAYMANKEAYINARRETEKLEREAARMNKKRKRR